MATSFDRKTWKPLRPAISALALACLLVQSAPVAADESDFDRAAKHGAASSEALARVHEILHTWAGRKDVSSGLLGGGAQGETWNVSTTAARLYPALVLAAWTIDRPIYDGLLRETLRDEARLTSRVSSLPDDYNLARGAFASSTTDLDVLVDQAAQYAHGLSLVTQVAGGGPWHDRLRGLVDVIFLRARVTASSVDGPLPSENAATNGYLLRLLPLLAGVTGDEGYLYYARRIADAYCVGVLPKNGSLPADRWDFAADRSRSGSFTLDEGGVTLVQGLALLYAVEAERESERAGLYRPVIAGMFDVLLDRAVADDGAFTRRITYDGRGGYGTDRRRRSTHGAGILAAAHLFGRYSGNARYIDLVTARFESLIEGRDGTPIPDILSLFEQLAAPEPAAAFASERARAVLAESADGLRDEIRDANRIRSLLAYAWLGRAGMRAVPWREDVRLGATSEGETLYIDIRSDRNWEGRIEFDVPRSRDRFGLASPDPFNHGFPEWFAVDPGEDYVIRIEGASGPARWSGRLLAEGLPVSIRSGRGHRISLSRIPPVRDIIPVGTDTTTLGAASR